MFTRTDAEFPGPASNVADAMRLGDVEAAITALDSVHECVVIARASSNGEARRVAYVVPRSDGTFLPEDFVRTARERLRPDCAPDACVELRSMPLTAAGDVNITALLSLEVLDDGVLAAWTAAIRELPGVNDAAVIDEETPDSLAAIHLADVLPGFGQSVGDDAAHASHRVAAEAPVTSGGHPVSPTVRHAFADGGPLRKPADAPDTIVEALFRAAERHGDRPIRLMQADGSELALCYATLLHDARCVLGGLRRHGFRVGDTAILQVSDLRQYLPVLWACLIGGIKPMTVAVPPSYDARNSIVRKLGSAWELLDRPAVLCATALASGIRGLSSSLAMANLRAVEVEALFDNPASDDVHPASPDEVAFFQLSSGSTGVSKCIQIRHGGIVSHTEAACQRVGYSSDDITLNWLSMDHVGPLLMCHMQDVYSGCESIQVPAPVVLADPLRWLDLMERYRVTHTWTPNFGYKMLADAMRAAPQRTWDLSSVKVFLNGGEQVTLPVVRDFLDQAARCGVTVGSMCPAYGMAETCTGITYDTQFALDRAQHFAKSSVPTQLRVPLGDEDAVTFVHCGAVLPGVQIRIADRAHVVVSEGTIGAVQVKGPVITPGYLNNPSANSDAFVGDGWFDTGDLGFLLEGQLTVTGREKELIIVNGANVYCHEIEDIAGDVPGVVATFVAACGIDDAATGSETLAVFFVHDEDSGLTVANVVHQLRTEIRSRSGIGPSFVVPIARDEFPKTTSGKIQRGQVKRWFLDGRFEAAVRQLDRQLGNANTLPAWFYRTRWVPRQADDAGGERLPGTVVIFATADVAASLQAPLDQMGGSTVFVQPGERYRRLDATRYVISSTNADDFDRVISSVASGMGPIGIVVHAWTCDPVDADEPMVGGVDRDLAAGPYSLLLLTHALRKKQQGRPTRLIVLSQGSAGVFECDPVSPARAASTALLKSVATEFAWLRCRHVDVDAQDTAGPCLATELRGPGPEDIVAYRQGTRWVRRIEPVDLAAAAPASPPFMRGGVYLLTGGLGGMAVEIARHLLHTYEAKLLLVGRTPLEQDTARRSALEGLGALPGRVRYEVVDVTDESQLRAAVRRASVDWSQPLDGVLHFAGIFGDLPLVQESVPHFAATLRPKIHGTVALHRVAAERPGSLFVSCSSVNGLFGAFGAAAYATANAFLDAFVHGQRRQGSLRSCCLAWSTWDETGMSRGLTTKHAAQAQGFRVISPQRGVQSFIAALHRELPHLLVGLDGNGRAVRRHVVTNALAGRSLVAYYAGNRRLSAKQRAGIVIEDAFGTRVRCDARLVDVVPRTARGQVDRRTLAQVVRGGAVEHVVPQTDLERMVATVWEAALKQDGLGVRDNFFEVGGSSVLAAQIAGRLRERLKTDVPVVAIFQYPTIASLAAFLADRSADAGQVVAESHSRGALRRETARRMRRA